MVDLSTTWLGLNLENPFVAGASPLSDSVETVRKLVDAGAAAVVTQSLFEEQLSSDQMAMHTHTDGVGDMHGEALSYFPSYEDVGLGPDAYLRHIEALKAAVDVPVIGSLNGTTPGGWVRYAKYIEEAGADALEVNVYYVATETTESPAEVEQRYVDVLTGVKAAVNIPVAMKLGPYFSSLGHFANRLGEAGADGLLLFNRFYQPDIDINELEAIAALHLSEPSELLLRLRWLAALYGRVDTDLAVTGGVHDAEAAIKSLMAGAQSVQMVSSLLKHGPAHLGKVKQGMIDWMEENEYDSIEQMIGSMSLERSPDPAAFSRVNYRRILGTWHKF
jgi:dihydroorotate dehydrogenase (fumarate)